jgi:hypothetical protein
MAASPPPVAVWFRSYKWARSYNASNARLRSFATTSSGGTAYSTTGTTQQQLLHHPYAGSAERFEFRTEVERRRLETTARWLDTIVIRHRMCPFAAAALTGLRLRASRAAAAEDVIIELLEEAVALDHRILNGGGGGGGGDWAASETTLLVLDAAQPWASSWHELTRLSWELQAALAGQRGEGGGGENDDDDGNKSGMAERLQMVLFHPAAVHSLYTADPNRPDPADFAIRAPHPTVQLLRECDVLAAVKDWGADAVAAIPARNAARLRKVGVEVCRARLAACGVSGDGGGEEKETTE